MAGGATNMLRKVLLIILFYQMCITDISQFGISSSFKLQVE